MMMMRSISDCPLLTRYGSLTDVGANVHSPLDLINHWSIVCEAGSVAIYAAMLAMLVIQLASLN